MLCFTFSWSEPQFNLKDTVDLQGLASGFARLPFHFFHLVLSEGYHIHVFPSILLDFVGKR